MTELVRNFGPLLKGLGNFYCGFLPLHDLGKIERPIVKVFNNFSPNAQVALLSKVFQWCFYVFSASDVEDPNLISGAIAPRPRDSSLARAKALYSISVPSFCQV